MTFLELYILWFFPVLIDPPPNEMVATEDLPNTDGCAIGYNLNPTQQSGTPEFTLGQKATFYCVTGLAFLLFLCTIPFSVPIAAFVAWWGDILKKRVHAKAIQAGSIPGRRPLPPYREVIDRLHNSEWVGQAPDGEIIKEREHVFLGKVRQSEIAYLISIEQIRKNMHIIGPTGRGKDFAVIDPTMIQLVTLGWHVVKINHKKDDDDVKICHAMASVCGVPYKLFTLDTRKPCNMMNFYEMSHRHLVNDQTWGQMMLAALGLNVGTPSAGTFHIDKAWQAYDPVHRHFDPKTFQEQLDILHDPSYARRFKLQDYDFKYANHLFAKLAQPAGVVALNLTKETAPPEVYENRINIGPDILSRPGITYIDLPSDTDGTISQVISDMLCQQILAAANVWEGQRVPVLVVVSDAGRAMGPTLNQFLRHCRSFGISLCISHQSFSDLKVGAIDYGPSISQNCAVRVSFGGADPDLVRQMQLISGTVKKKLGTFSEDPDEPDGLREVEVPRIGPEDVLAASMKKRVAIVDVRPSAGLCAFRHPTFVDIDFPVSWATFKRIAGGPWPTGTGMFIASEYQPPTAQEKRKQEKEAEKKAPPPPKQPIRDFLGDIAGNKTAS